MGRQTGQDRQRSDSIGRTVLPTVSQKQRHNICFDKMMLGSDVTVIWLQYDLCVAMWGNMAYCVNLSVEDLLRYPNKVECWFKNVRVITILLRK